MFSYPRSADCVGSDRELESFPLQKQSLAVGASLVSGNDE